MMQPSELDRTFLSSSPTNLKKDNKMSGSGNNNHLSLVSKINKSDINNNYINKSETNGSEMSAKDIFEKETSEPGLGSTPDIAKPDISQIDLSNESKNGNTCSPSVKKSDVNHKSNHNNVIDLPLLNGTSGNNIEKNNDKNNIDVKEQDTQDQGFLPVLKNPNFLALWSGQVFCQLADKVYLVLMIALINTQFQSGDQTISGWVSALMMTFTIPAVLFGSVAGAFVDRWSKKAVLVGTNIWRGILVLAIPPLLWLTHDWQSLYGLPIGFVIILAVTFLVSTLTQFFAPAEQAVIPLVVKPHNLLSANSLYTTTMMASVIVGFAVGEPLLAAADKIWVQIGGSGGLGKEIIVGGSYGIAGIILLLLKTNEKPRIPQETEEPHILADLRDGLKYLGQNKRIRNAIIQLIILFSVFAALTVLAVRLAEIIPNIKPEQFGFLLAAGGVGIAIGATLLGQFGQRFSYTQLSFFGCIGMAASLTGLSLFTEQLLIVLTCLTMLGVFGALVGIPMQTSIQTETPPEMRGKVFGLQNNVINIALSLPLALAGVAETFIGLQAEFLVLAAIVFSGCILTWYNSSD
jgi:MFS family permease